MKLSCFITESGLVRKDHGELTAFRLGVKVKRYGFSLVRAILFRALDDVSPLLIDDIQ